MANAKFRQRQCSNGEGDGKEISWLHCDFALPRGPPDTAGYGRGEGRRRLYVRFHAPRSRNTGAKFSVMILTNLIFADETQPLVHDNHLIH